LVTMSPNLIPYDYLKFPSDEQLRRAREFFELCTSRRMLRHFSSKSVSRDLLETLIRTASHSQMQYLVEGPLILKQFVTCRFSSKYTRPPQVSLKNFEYTNGVLTTESLINFLARRHFHDAFRIALGLLWLEIRKITTKWLRRFFRSS
jgi:hypothetical protein